MKVIEKDDLESFVETINERFELNIPECWNQHEPAVQYLVALYFFRSTVEIMSDGNGLLASLQRIFDLPMMFREKLTPGCMNGCHMKTKYERDVSSAYDASLIATKKINQDFDDQFMDENDPELLPGRVYTVQEMKELAGLTDEEIDEFLAGKK